MKLLLRCSSGHSVPAAAAVDAAAAVVVDADASGVTAAVDDAASQIVRVAACFGIVDRLRVSSLS